MIKGKTIIPRAKWVSTLASSGRIGVATVVSESPEGEC